MKKTFKWLMPLVVLSAFLFAVSCGGGGKKADLSEKGQLLTSISWKLDPNATLKGTTDAVEDTSGITADIQLQGDVKKFADFVAETVIFGVDTKDPSKLSYSRTIGEGFLSSSVLGYWNFNEDESAIIMREWDSQAGKEKDPVTYTIVELSPEKLVLQKEGAASPNIYFPKK
ncbi:MAG: hypothetical protein P1P88_12375 [Bacteroidales bacterium]|nr:hypothetical protein [Bacteroidales bacterium]